MPAPPVQDAFDFYLMQFEAHRWYPVPLPGWPAMLALGVRAGVPWLVNPVLAGLNVLMIYILLWELYSRRTARMAVFLLCISPWYAFLAMSFMTHTFSLTCALVASVGIVWARRTGRAVWAWLGGLALGMLALIRPLEGLIMAGLLGLWAIGLGGRRLKGSAIAGLVIGSVAIGATMLPFNQYLTGDPTMLPMTAYGNERYGPKVNALGFGPDRGLGWAHDPYPGHSPRDALVNANLNTFSINVELLGWSMGSLALIALILLSGALNKSDYLVLAVIVAVFAAHFFYYFGGGPDFGARYWFLMIVPCVVLTVRGMQHLRAKLESGPSGSASAGVRVMAAVLVLCVLALANFFPWRAIDKYHHYRGMRPDVRYLAEEHGFGTSLVLIRGDEHSDYASATVYNPLDVRADGPVYAWDRNPEVRAQVLDAYRDRPVWIVDGPTLTGQGYRVAEGPLSARELLASERDDE
jgi:hypothetical protein